MTLDQLRATISQRAQSDWSGGFVAQNCADIRAAGLAELTVPSALGGPGAGIEAAAAVVREISAGDASTGLILAMHYIHTTRLFALADGPSEPVRKLAARILSGGELVALAASEQLSGAPSRGGLIKTTARRAPDGSWVLNGTKTYATGARAAGTVVIAATLVDGGERAHFLVPTDAPGFEVVQTWDAAGLRGSDSQDLRLTDVRLDSDALVERVGVDGKGTDTTQPIWWPLLLASVHLGIAEAARAEAISFSAGPPPDRGDGTLADTIRVRNFAARAEFEIVTARALLRTALADAADGVLEPAYAATTKVLVHSHATAAVDQYGLLIGASSMRLTSPFQRYYRDLRVALHNPPAEDLALTMLAGQVLGPIKNGS